MHDIAIYFEKYDLGNDRFIFKPTSVIRGTYDGENDQFITDFGTICDNIQGDYFDSDYYFGCETTMERLKKNFGENNSDAVLLDEYFNICTDYCYIGYFDDEYGELIVKTIPFEELEYDTNIESTIAESDEFDSKAKFIFNLDGIKALGNLNDMSEVRKIIDNLISLYGQIIGDPEGVEEKESKEDEAPEEERKEGLTTLKTSEQIISLKELRKEILRNIVGQDRAVNDLTREIMVNQTSSNPRNKSHILVTGPTGTGKTEIARTISGILDLPFFEADATAYTKEGYVGKSPYSMIESLIDMANGDIEKAQKGILVIDEIDKKVDDKDNVSGTAVLQSLYKMMDRGVIEIDTGRPGYRNAILFDTSNLTIILMGAFEDLYQNKLKVDKVPLGFEINPKKMEVLKKEIILTKNDLYKGGVPSELLGRIGDITSTNFFDVNGLVDILTKSKTSALLLQQQYFNEVFGVDLRYTSGYTTKIAERAIEAKTNARELKPLVRESLKYATDEFLMGRRGKVLKLTKETALDPRKYYVE